MERVTLGALLALGACLVPVAAVARDVDWYTQVDNDVFAAEDRWYTSGIRIARTQRLADGSRLELGLVQETYTPDVRVASLVDRPYAARLLLSAAWHVTAPGLHRTLQLDAGVRGPSAYGRQTADLVHRVVPAREFDWSRQLPDRADVQAVAVQTHDCGFAGSQRVRWALHYGGVVGTMLGFAHAGVELRVGGDPIPAQALRFAATPPVPAGGTHGLSGFAGASIRGIARNRLLLQNANRFGPSIEREHSVLRAAVGVAWSAPWGALTFTGVQDSREFETQRGAHRFGIVGLRVDF